MPTPLTPGRHIIQIEKGEKAEKVLITTLHKLAVGLEVPVVWFAFGGGDGDAVPDGVRLPYNELAAGRRFTAG